MPDNPEKKGEVGGVSGGREEGPHYACLEVEERGKRELEGRSPAKMHVVGRRREEEGRSPTSLGIDAW